MKLRAVCRVFGFTKVLILGMLLVTNWAVGQKYKVGYTEKGKASYYAEKFHGRLTASGEKYNMYANTCAHRKLPFGTILKVTNLGNGKWITVKVNDRGPFKSNRILDLSKGAAAKIDMIKAGIGNVKIEIISMKGSGGTTGTETTVVAENDKKSPIRSVGTYSVWGTSKKVVADYGVQIASYTNSESAAKEGKRAIKLGLDDIYIQSGWLNGKKCYRVLYGAFSKSQARKEIRTVKKKGYKGAFLKKHL
ncbi:septal ring lytic transglycosylase RlpA family protein [Limibacter armeniacum]|uniref:septal ring lytic transglycosylase RlpA family protein n=1 Tax=Limibacter armeniacum TaxID=466084 RepID=UPI002FE61E54